MSGEIGTPSVDSHNNSTRMMSSDAMPSHSQRHLWSFLTSCSFLSSVDFRTALESIKSFEISVD
jgi:hypothetical protein